MSQAPPAMQGAQLEDLRASLAAQASRAEQRNRPRALLLVACIVLVIGGWFAWSGYSASADATARADKEQRDADAVLKAAGKLQALQARGDIQVNAPMAQLLSRIEGMGATAGLKTRVPLGQSQTKREPTLGWNQVKNTYTIKDPELPSVLKWIELVIADIPGMEVHTITIRPEATEWVVIVTFSRWEKAEGGT